VQTNNLTLARETRKNVVKKCLLRERRIKKLLYHTA